MTDKLAKLEGDGGLKQVLDFSGTEKDAELTAILKAASAMAERIAGLPNGGLRRATTITEYPWSGINSTTLALLAHRPIESVTSIKQLYSSSTTAEFTAATALTEITDYVIRSANLGTIERVNSTWLLATRYVQVIYTGGFVDPARIEIALATATWTAATKTLTQVGAFAAYTFASGDMIVITGGTGATVGTYQIASRTSDDAIVLSTSLASGDLATGDITSGYSGMILPPEDIQRAIVLQSTMIWNTRANAGLGQINLGDGGGSFTTKSMQPHPELVAAAGVYRRLLG